MKSAQLTDTDRDRLEGLVYRARWLVLLWIIGLWINFLHQAKVIGSLGAKLVGEFLSWLR